MANSCQTPVGVGGDWGGVSPGGGGGDHRVVGRRAFSVRGGEVGGATSSSGEGVVFLLFIL
jgi:hypothetical protein